MLIPTNQFLRTLIAARLAADVADDSWAFATGNKLGFKIDAGSTIDVTITGNAAKGPVTVHRTGELGFTKAADGWRLDSWRLTVTRDGKGVPAAPRTSSTTKAP